MRTPGSAAELEARRHRAAEYFQERMPLQKIALLMGVSLSSIKRWYRAWKSQGTQGLAAKPHPGRAPKLTPKQRKRLAKLLLSGPLAAGFSTNLWTCKRVSLLVKKKFDVDYHPDHVRRILHDLGFSPQKPRQVAREQDPAAVERWRRRDWPRIKKRPGESAQPSFSSTKQAFACSRSFGALGRREVKHRSSARGIVTID